MRYGGDDDEAKIAAANLLDNYREEWQQNFENNKEISEKINDYISNIQTIGYSNISPKDIIGLLNQAIMSTPANKKSNEILAFRVNELIRHMSRRKPNPRLTIKYLRTCQQAYINSTSAHFTLQSNIVTTILLGVFQNVNIMSRTKLIPKGVQDEMNEYKDFMDNYEENDE